MSVTSQVSNVRNENYYGFGVKGFHTKMKKKKRTVLIKYALVHVLFWQKRINVSELSDIKIFWKWFSRPFLVRDFYTD